MLGRGVRIDDHLVGEAVSPKFKSGKTREEVHRC
jgi:hypothetical protein